MRSDQYCSIETFAKIVKEHIDEQYDGLVAISGDRGEGKSVFARLFLREYCKLISRKFDLEHFTYYSKKSFDEDIQTNEMNQIFLLDEAISILFNRERLEDMQVDLIKKINICRYKGHMVALLIPIFWNLDKGIRDLVRVLLYVEKRPINGKPGYAHIFKKVNSVFVTDPWMLKRNEKLAGRWWKSPNYYGTVVIPDLSGEVWFQEMEAEALRIKDTKKNEALEENKDLLKEKNLEVILPFFEQLRINRCLKQGSLDTLAAYTGLSRMQVKDKLFYTFRLPKRGAKGEETNKQPLGGEASPQLETDAEVLL